MNIVISPWSVKPGLVIWHFGVVINANAKIGKNCQFHGDNCVGNKGVGSEKSPILGDNIDVGFGAVILGGITIADDCVIGANAVVTKSCLIPGSILVGVPAKAINKKRVISNRERTNI